jgi:hypothetical protein
MVMYIERNLLPVPDKGRIEAEKNLTRRNYP